MRGPDGDREIGVARIVDREVETAATRLASAVALSTNPYPEFPAATTTTTPDLTSRLTSMQSGLCPHANHSGWKS